MGTVIQDMPQSNHGSQPRWDRCERADLFAQYREWRTQGLSERQAAKELKVPRTTLHAWRRWHDSLDICPHVADVFQSGPGLAFLHRLVIALHMVCVEVGACGIRLVCLFLHLTGLDRFVAASYGAQQQVNVQIEQAIVDYDQSEPPRVAKARPHKDLTVTQDENLHRRPVPHHHGPREQLHHCGTTGAGTRSSQLECRHGTGSGTVALPSHPIDQRKVF